MSAVNQMKYKRLKPTMESTFLIIIGCLWFKICIFYYNTLNMEANDAFLVKFSKIDHILGRGAKFACTGRQNIKHGIRTGRQNPKTGSGHDTLKMATKKLELPNA